MPPTTPTTPADPIIPRGITYLDPVCPTCAAAFTWPDAAPGETVKQQIARRLQPQTLTCPHCQTTSVVTFAQET